MFDSGPAEHDPGAGAAGAAQEQPVPAMIVTTDARAFLRGLQTHSTFRAHRQHAGLECGQCYYPHRRW